MPASRISGGLGPIGAPIGGLGIVLVGLSMLGGGQAEARGIVADKRLPEGTRLTAPEAPASEPYMRGKALLAGGDAPGAIAAFRAALVDDPQSVDALNGMAIAFDRLGRYDIARGYYDSALALAPDSALVLNNLGYSLYLQGDDAAAIPLLRRALAAAAPGGPSPAQRILTMIAARMRSKVVATETAIARAEVTAPAARVELSASGEQRLVFAAAAPDPEVVARLGDAAPLISVAKPWTAADDAAVNAEAAAAAPVPAIIPAPPTPAPVVQLADFGIAAPPPVVPPMPQRRRENDPAQPAPVRVEATEISRAPRSLILADRPAHGPVLAPVPAALPFKVATPPPTPAPPAPAPIVLLPPVMVAAFDSDDAELNAFAARMVAWRSADAA